MKKTIAMLWLLAGGALTGCGDETRAEGLGYFLMNGAMTTSIEIELGESVAIEFVPGNDLRDIEYRWSSPDGGTVTKDDSRLASFTPDMPGRFAVYSELSGRDPEGKAVTYEFGLLVLVKQANRQWMTGVIDRVTFDGVPQPHGGTSPYGAGQSIEIVVDEADDILNTDVQAEVSAGELVRRGYNQFRWNLPPMPGLDATIDITTLGRRASLDVGEMYTHMIHLE